VAEHEVVALRTVLPKLLLELGGCFGLDMADGRAEGVTNPQESLIRAAVPGLIADRARGEEPRAVTQNPMWIAVDNTDEIRIISA